MLRRRTLSAALVWAVLVALAAEPALAQVDGESVTPGATCPAGAVIGKADKADWDTFFECNASNQWQRGPYFFGATSDTCDSNHAGMVQWTGSIFQGCNGTSWGPIDISTSAALSSLLAATATNSIDSGNYAQTWKWGTLTTQTALALTTSSMTTGTLMSLSNTSTANAAGTVLSITSSEIGGQALAVTGTSDFNGNVGIGTASPWNILDVRQNTNNNATISIENLYSGQGAYLVANANSNWSAVQFTGTGANWQIGQLGSANLMVYDATDNKTPFAIVQNAPNNSLYITSTGSVGMGTTAPATPLDVNGAVRIGTSSLLCTTSLAGAERYNSGSAYMEYCNGSAWGPFEQPQCLTGSSAACWLPSTRSTGDSNFIAANVANGVSILGVTGTYGSCSFTLPSATLFPTPSTRSELSTVVPSNIVQITTNSCNLPVSISGGASPQYQTCNDSACSSVIQAWTGTAGTIANGKYLQVRQTSSGSYNTASTVTVTLGADATTNWTVTTGVSNGYFVLDANAYNGNLGNLSGANALCLSDLKAGSWLGKSSAILDSSHVFAFLCNESTCNNLLASTTYDFATTAYSADGGATFTTDGSGVGPGDANWWTGTTYFGTGPSSPGQSYAFYWSGRGETSNTAWTTTTPWNTDGVGCANWTVGTNADQGVPGVSSSPNYQRWETGGGNTCDTQNFLLCYVNP